MSTQDHSVRPNQPLRPHRRRKPRPGGAGPAWPSFKGNAQRVGTSSSGLVTVWVDPTLGDPALQNANELLAAADDVVQKNNTIFNTQAEHVDVIVFALNGATDGTGGADHDGCDFQTGNAIEVDASFGNAGRVTGLFEAELSECAMNGRLCGVSTGEALSRWCAAVVSNNALADFATAPSWAGDGMPDWVNHTEPTDQNAISTGCGMAFISWLLGQEGVKLPAIAEEMVQLTATGTLADVYAQLTGKPAGDAWAAFTQAIDALPNGVTTDDPFNGFANAL